jgi:hypothetical protein
MSSCRSGAARYPCFDIDVPWPRMLLSCFSITSVISLAYSQNFRESGHLPLFGQKYRHASAIARVNSMCGQFTELSTLRCRHFEIRIFVNEQQQVVDAL